MKKRILTLIVAFATGVATLNAQSKIYDFPFNNSYNATVGTGSFTPNDSTSFVTDRHGNASSALRIKNYITEASLTGLPSGTGGRTISLWVKLEAFDPNGVNMLFGFGGSSNNAGNIGLIDNTNAYYSGYGSSMVTASTTNNLNLWYHYVFTYDGTVASIYKDGVLLGSDTRTWSTSSSSNFYLGSGIYSQPYFDGAIDDLRIYDYALSQSEVTALYGATTGIVYQFPFDNSYDATVGTGSFADNSTNSSFVTDRHGNANGAVFINNYQMIASGLHNLPQGANPRSISLWTKLTEFNSSGVNFLYMYGGGANYMSDIGLITPAEVWHSGYASEHKETATHSLEEWYHFVFSYDGTNSLIYRNGTLLGTSPRTWNTYFNGYFTLGGDGTSSFFKGAIDDLQIYNYTLSVAEVAELYNPTTAGINEINTSNITAMYPNPANSVLNIEVKDISTPLNVQIVNVLGAIVATQKLNTGNNTVDVSNLTRGVYFISIANGGAVKFIKE